MKNLYNDAGELLKKQEEDMLNVLKRSFIENSKYSSFSELKKEMNGCFYTETHLVTGGNGCIGSHIVEYLVATRRDIRVVVVDNYYNSTIDHKNLKNAFIVAESRNNEIIIENIDITMFYDLYQVFNKYTPHFVYHQASMLTLDSKKYRREAINTNIVGFVNVVECCLEFNVRKLVYASSASVFGNPSIIPVKESHDFENCKLLYGATKICDEYLAKSYCDEEGLKFVGLRYFNVYSDRQSYGNIYTQIVPKWINALLYDGDIEIYNDGKQTMDLIHGYDVARMNVIAMEKNIFRGCSFGINIFGSDIFNGFINIGTGIETSVLELYNIIREEVLNQAEIFYDPKPKYITHDPNLVRRRKCGTYLMNLLLGKHMIDVKDGIKYVVKNLIERSKSQ